MIHRYKDTDGFSKIKKSPKMTHFMIKRDDLGKIMSFVASRWVAESREPDSKIMTGLPNDFWMNSVGGKTANGGFWVTSLMYTENEADAAAFKEVLLRWQSKGNSKNSSANKQDTGNLTTDLIKISKLKSKSNHHHANNITANETTTTTNETTPDAQKQKD